MSLIISRYKTGFMGTLKHNGKTYYAYAFHREHIIPILRRKAGIK